MAREVPCNDFFQHQMNPAQESVTLSEIYRAWHWNG